MLPTNNNDTNFVFKITFIALCSSFVCVCVWSHPILFLSSDDKLEAKPVALRPLRVPQDPAHSNITDTFPAPQVQS